MTKTLLSLMTVAALCGLAVQAQDKPKTEDKPVSNPTADEVAVITTTEGTMVAEFWPDVRKRVWRKSKPLITEDTEGHGGTSVGIGDF